MLAGVEEAGRNGACVAVFGYRVGRVLAIGVAALPAMAAETDFGRLQSPFRPVIPGRIGPRPHLRGPTASIAPGLPGRAECPRGGACPGARGSLKTRRRFGGVGVRARQCCRFAIRSIATFPLPGIRFPAFLARSSAEASKDGDVS
nr:hypothetical protein [uncultured bacterium]